jgi:acetylglutamate kinase
MIERAIEKASILVEALPYIKKFHGKTMVIKYGGSTIGDSSMEKNFALDIVLMKYVGINPVLVHGGGPFITKALKERGRESQFVEGLRITDKEDIDIVSRILAQVNQEIVSLISKAEGEAIGLENVIEARRLAPFGKSGRKIDIGFVGEVVGVSAEVNRYIKEKAIPIINPLGKGAGGEPLNVNADAAAARVAIELKAEKFIILTDVPGIMRNWADKDSLISTLALDEVELLIKRKVIINGMVPKVKACIKALECGVEKVHILDGRVNHSLLLEIFTDAGIGTQIVTTPHN